MYELYNHWPSLISALEKKPKPRNTYVVEVDGRYLTWSRLFLKPVHNQGQENEEEKSLPEGITAERPSLKVWRSKRKRMKGQ